MIREMNDQDIETCYEIQAESIIHPWSHDMFVDDYKNDNSLYYVHETDDAITSYIAYQIVLDEATIMSIATKQDERKKGYGNVLLNGTFNKLKDKGIKKIFLEVRSTNVDAINLYKKNEFEEMSVRKNYYNDPTCDAIIMVKNL
ncbi:MAG: ribosomal protein S18-alanine N-acetyltransferase [Clostridia bacterium]|nr:ribosomal protein S18-alanine N-acetyltransferase [Clostridia bacterium]